MLVNQRSHSHGQGWTDLNFLIPELADRLDYRKGPYSADAGDFAAAGTLDVRYADALDDGIASIGIGQHGFRRALLADSPALGKGSLLYTLEAFHNDGPFTRGDNYRKLNGVLRYSEGSAVNGWNLSAMAYKASWNASDQIPRRAVADAGVSTRSTPAMAAARGVTACRAAGAPIRMPARAPSTPMWLPTSWRCIRTSPTFSTTRSTATSLASRTGASRRA